VPRRGLRHAVVEKTRRKWRVKVRKTCRFPKDWRRHEASTYFSLYNDNFR